MWYVMKFGCLFRYWEVCLVSFLLFSFLVRRCYLEQYEEIDKVKLKSLESWKGKYVVYDLSGKIKIQRKYLYEW